MNNEAKADWVQYACDHQMMILGIYRGKVRFFTVISLFRSNAGHLLFRSFDSTHGDEEVPRTYKIEELLLAGITRVRPVRVDIKEQ